MGHLERLETFEKYRRLVVGLAYRMTGSFSGAEDIAQEALIRWNSATAEPINNPKAWLSKTATRLSLDYLKSARVQREVYFGPWLPEPFIDESHDPESLLELDESLSMALLLVLERLNPRERVAYILHEVFDFSHSEVSEFLGTSEGNSRQLTSRAKKKINQGGKRHSPSMAEHARLTSSFLEAIKNGNIEELKVVFAENVKLHSDGGGKAIAVSEVLSGADVVASFLIEKVSKAFAENEVSAYVVWFNGAPGILLKHNDVAETAFDFEIRNGKVAAIHALRNPDKLKLFQPSATWAHRTMADQDLRGPVSGVPQISPTGRVD